MIKLSNTLTVLERNNDGSIASILIIKKEEAPVGLETRELTPEEKNIVAQRLRKV